MLRLFLKICFFITAALLIIFLLPHDTKKAAKNKIIDVLSNVLPASAKEKLEDFTSSPAEKREKFIAQIEQELATAKKVLEQAKLKKQGLSIAASSGDSPAEEEIIKNIEAAEQILGKIEENNNEPGIIKKAITSVAGIVKDIINSPVSSTSGTNSGANSSTNSDNPSIITSPTSIATSTSATSTQTQLPICLPCVCQ